MRTRNDILAKLTNPGIIAIVRAQKREQVLPATEALLAGGVNAIEITLTTPDGLALIKEAFEKFSDVAVIGAGTVLTADQCRAVLAYGADFVVTPLARPDFVPIIYTANRVSIIGAFTPTEAHWSLEAGADFIKLFPAEVLGPTFIKSVRAPIPELRFIPTGWQSAVEAVVEALYNLVVSTVGERHGRRFFPVIATIFLYVVVANWFALLPFFNVIGKVEPLGTDKERFHEEAVVFKDTGVSLIMPNTKEVKVGEIDEAPCLYVFLAPLERRGARNAA